MKTDWRALCAELVAWADNASARYYSPPEVLIRARAALAEADGPAVPEGREPASVVGEPSDEELNRLLWYEFTTSTGHGEHTDPIGFARAVLARWGHQPAPPAEGEQRHPAPVPVSERLPGAEDCDAEGRCWIGHWCDVDGDALFCWELDRPGALTWKGIKEMDGWLPATALPLPAGEVEPNDE